MKSESPSSLEHLISKNLLSVVTNSIIAVDLTGTITFWNSGAERIFGYTKDEMLNKSLKLIYPEFDENLLFDDLERIKNGGSYVSEWEGRNKSGEVVWVDLSTNVLKDDNNNIIGFIGLSRDITDQKQTLKKLHESEVKYQAIFENSGEGFFLMTDVFIDVNKKACELFEYSKEEIIGKSPLDFSPEMQADGVSSERKANNYIRRAFKDGYATFYWQHKSKSKKLIDTRITLNRILIKDKNYLIAIMHNMTEIIKYQNKLKVKTKHLVDQNKKMLQLNDELNETNNRLKIINQLIEQSEAKFRVAFKTSPDAININTIQDGLYVDINEGFTNLTGYTENDVKDKTSLELKIWENQNDRIRLINALIENESVSNFETQFRRKDGSVTTVLMSASFIEINNGKYILSITRDISERKETEEKLKKAMVKAEESDLLKSAFLANMSHEIRTPMNAILGFSQLLKEKKIEYEKQDKFLDIIVSRSQNLLQIINDIIDISKIEANQLKIEINKFSLNKLLYELYSFFEAELYTHKKSHVNISFSSDIKIVLGDIKSDEIRLKQILTNLISNAIKFTDQGKIEFGYNLKENNIEFFVRDTGTGIPEESQKYIFERFRQVDGSITREFGGTGLGLSICKQLVELLGGKIWLESEFNKGSTFYFTIPFENVNSDSNNKDSNIKGNLDLTGKTILIVEDDLISMTYLEELLIITNASILKAYDGEKAIDLFKENSNIDIVLMDVYLPKMTGNEATKEIKKINKSVPVIIQSAYALPSDKKESFKYGCDDYITKPIDPRLLMFTMKKYIQ